MCISIYIYIYICICICIHYVCNVYIYIYIHNITIQHRLVDCRADRRRCVYARIRLRAHACVYLYVYVCIYIYIYMCIYIYINICHISIYREREMCTCINMCTCIYNYVCVQGGREKYRVMDKERLRARSGQILCLRPVRIATVLPTGKQVSRSLGTSLSLVHLKNAKLQGAGHFFKIELPKLPVAFTFHAGKFRGLTRAGACQSGVDLAKLCNFPQMYCQYLFKSVKEQYFCSDPISVDPISPQPIPPDDREDPNEGVLLSGSQGSSGRNGKELFTNQETSSCSSSSSSRSRLKCDLIRRVSRKFRGKLSRSLFCPCDRDSFSHTYTYIHTYIAINKCMYVYIYIYMMCIYIYIELP